MVSPQKFATPPAVKSPPVTANRSTRTTWAPLRAAAQAAAAAAKERYQEAFSAAGYGDITTEIVAADDAPFYWAEAYHQQYLEKNPNGYCPIHATGVTCG